MLNTRQAVLAEGLGTGILVAAVVGSGIAAQGLTHDVGLQLLINALSTVAALGVLIALLLPISGAHFNPAITLVAVIRGDIKRVLAVGYIVSQCVGAIIGAVLANTMFEHSAMSWASSGRSGYGQWTGEAVATAGLVLTVLLANRSHLPIIVPAWIGAAYFFTSSTSFANPAVTLGRAFTHSFSGIAWEDVPMFVIAQILGALAALVVVSLLASNKETA
ncbi:MAG: MIP/aquaporin family protein [Aeromicrobium sp.]